MSGRESPLSSMPPLLLVDGLTKTQGSWSEPAGYVRRVPFNVLAMVAPVFVRYQWNAGRYYCCLTHNHPS